MKIYLSRHAKKRMKERKISLEEIVLVLENPTQTTPTIRGRNNYFKTIDDKHIKVTCKEEKNKITVVTVMVKDI